jgi:hypothetical protein
MGQFRGMDYGAVIGVGGIGSEPKAHGIDGKVNWGILTGTALN